MSDLAKTVLLDDHVVQVAAEALYAEAQREGWGCPPSWGEPSWRAWYRKTVRLVLEAALAAADQAEGGCVVEVQDIPEKTVTFFCFSSDNATS
jgi:hypothetical protein